MIYKLPAEAFRGQFLNRSLSAALRFVSRELLCMHT